MKQLLLLFICVLAIFACTSCITDNDDNHDAQEAALSGTIKDANGNVITDAEVCISFYNRWDENTEKDSIPPVELSSFTATVTEQHFVQLAWTTQFENNLYGFYLFRNSSNNLNEAQVISSYISATNTNFETNYNFNDTELYPGTWYYWLQSLEMNGGSAFHGPILITVIGDPDPPVIPVAWALNVTYPNPSQSYCTIPLTVKAACHISLKISSEYLGAVRTIINDNKAPGMYRCIWDGKDDDGNQVCNGVYTVEMIATNSADSVLFRDSELHLIDDLGYSNPPAVYSNASGYRIPLQKYFQFGKQIRITDENGNHLTNYVMNGDFDIIIRKTGYETITRHVSLSSNSQSHKESFVMQPVIKRR